MSDLGLYNECKRYRYANNTLREECERLVKLNNSVIERNIALEELNRSLQKSLTEGRRKHLRLVNKLKRILDAV